jgi:hypothetical protein
MTNTMLYTTTESPIGELLLAGDGRALHRLDMREGKRPVAIDPSWARDDGAFAEVSRQLGEYFDGARRAFDVPIALAGNQFGCGSGRRYARFRTARPPATGRSRNGSASRAPRARSGWRTGAIRSL